MDKQDTMAKAKAMSAEYKDALKQLTFNSKPTINMLTLLAEDNVEYAQAIVEVVCDRIRNVAREQKMPSLYLLDSILKNVGGEYVIIISKYIVDTFCCVFEAAPDEKSRLALFKLRKTWGTCIPSKVLDEMDVKVSQTDPNWPVRKRNPGTGSPNVIHVNPKFLQKKRQRRRRKLS